MIEEIWKTIAGFDGYEVSNIGRVRSTERLVKTSNGIRRFQGRILACVVSKRNYNCVTLSSKDTQRKQLRVGRLVVDAFIRKLMPGEEVNHIDFDSLNDVLQNLEIVSHDKNIKHSVLAGRMSKKLTEQQVREIKKASLAGEKQTIICRSFGVTVSAVNYIANNKIWKHVRV
jgi:hypothetical protein